MSDEPRKTYYLDDLTVGQRFTSGTYHVTTDEIVAFARHFDPQPFHTDPEAAKHTFFGQLVASGWHTAAITMRLLVEGGMPAEGGIVGAGGEIGWPKPTLPGSTLHVESEILEIRPSRSRPDRGMVTVRCETKNEHGEVVQLMTTKVVVPRRVQ